MAHIEPSVKCMIKHERKIKKIRKKNMVLTSGNGGRWGGGGREFPPHLDNSIEDKSKGK